MIIVFFQEWENDQYRLRVGDLLYQVMENSWMFGKISFVFIRSGFINLYRLGMEKEAFLFFNKWLGYLYLNQEFYLEILVFLVLNKSFVCKFGLSFNFFEF